jgi:Tol biopolymer transport system component
MKRARLSLGDIVDIAIQVGGALAAAHQAGIVHRDIKPENIMLRRDGYVKVLDFGLAKLIEQHELTPHAGVAENVNISSGLVMGTVKYMSPEQARGQQVDARSDIFSFGVVLYEMLAGRTPFEGDNAGELIGALLKKEPPPLTNVPIEMQLIVSRALRKKREERYPTIQDMLAEFKGQSDHKTVAITGRLAPQSVDTSELSTVRTPTISTVSSIESIVSGIKRHKTGAVFIAASFAVLVLAVTFGLSRLGRKMRASSNQMRITRIPNLDKAQTVAISPDGKYVAQVTSKDSKYGIWLVELETGNNTPVVNTSGNDFLTDLKFSKDGAKIFYVTEDSLFQVPFWGGEAVKLADVKSPVTMAPDEKQVAFVSGCDQGCALTVSSLDGSGKRVLATRKAPELLGQPAWSPDGKVIACSVGRNASNRTQHLVAIEVTTGQEKEISSQRWQGFERVVWLPDGSGLLATAAETFGGPRQIWQISYPDGEVARITNDLDDYGDLGLTTDGKSLVTFQVATRSSLWLAPKGDPNGAKPITGSERPLYRAVSFTADGRLLFPSTIGGAQDIWIMNADGTNPKQLTANAGVNTLSNPCPNARYIVFASNRANNGAFNIWRMDMDGSNPIQLTFGSGEAGPFCSPDGLWILYSSGGPDVLNAKKTIWKIPIDGGEPVQLTKSPSNGPAISPDGTLFACWYKQDAGAPWQIALVPLAGGPPIKLLAAPENHTLWPRWTPEGQAISYISTSREGVSNIWSQPISGGPPKQVTQFTSETIDGFDWSRDGQLVCSRLHSAQDVILISDFR